MDGTVLLLGGNDYGTLAAARAFGKANMDVTVADENRRGRALHSRHVDRRLVHPPLTSAAELIDWLLEWGSRHPGALLYPSNDHLAWLYATERDRLSEVFAMHSPSEDVVMTLLDKKRLHQACEALGIDVPDTVFLSDDSQAQAVASTPEFPILVKPRTKTYQRRGIWGFIVNDRDELIAALRRFRAMVAYGTILSRRYPDVAQPMAQEFLAAAETETISISGYADERGVVAARSAVKVLQRPRRIGIGLCFEDRLVDADLVERLSTLCRAVGYYGAFEAEFVPRENRAVLIDFNPRFYSQMGFDIARELSLPLIVWHAANADHASADMLLERARNWKSQGRQVYCHKTMLDLLLLMQRLSAQLTKQEVAAWRVWYASHVAVDAVRDREDRLPAVVDAALWAGAFMRHPRSFLTEYVLNRPPRL